MNRVDAGFVRPDVAAGRRLTWTNLRNPSPPTVLKKSAIVLGSGTGDSWVPPTVVMTPSTVVMPPADEGTSSFWLSRMLSVLDAPASSNEPVGDRVERGFDARLVWSGDRYRSELR